MPKPAIMSSIGASVLFLQIIPAATGEAPPKGGFRLFAPHFMDPPGASPRSPWRGRTRNRRPDAV